MMRACNQRTGAIVLKNTLLMVCAAAMLAPAAAWAGKNQAPTVSITSPANGSTFAPPANITLTAAAADADGTITKVEFFNRRVLLGTSTTPPYSIVWSNVPLGTYSLTAKATDDRGGRGTSAPVTVTVATPPIAITYPADNQAMYVGADYVTGTFTGDPSTTTILLDNGDHSVLATKSGNTFSAIVAFPQGPFTITASLARTDRTYGSASVNVSGNYAPIVTWLQPTAMTFEAPVSIDLEAEVFSPGGSISKVEFTRNGTVLATITTPPYRYRWENAPTGTHNLAVVATDNNNIQNVPATRTITVTAPNTLPNVALTAPADGATFQEPATITLQATASDPDGSISRVEFLRDGAVIGTDTTSPYSFSWTNATQGSYALVARAVDNRSGMTTSATSTITVTAPNIPPTVSLDAPVNGEEFTSPANILLAASAADSDGTVMWVEFYRGTTLLGTDSTPPYNYAWNGVLAGTYALRARAIDNQGRATDSPVATISVVDPPNTLPVVSLTSPVDGATYGNPASIPLAATASDSDGTIARVEFYQGSTLIGSDTSSPYAMTWQNVPVGTYSVTARAVDNRSGATISAAANVTVTSNAVPTASVSASATDVFGPTTITLTATAADSDGTVTQVGFYANGNLIGTDTTAPYSFDWVDGAAGTYTVSARATDDGSAFGDSAPLSITIRSLAISIGQPSSGVMLVGNHVRVSGTLIAPFNSGVSINGLPTAIDDEGTRFYMDLPLENGETTIVATLTTQAGQTLEHSVTVTSDGATPFLDVTTTGLEVIAPNPVTFIFTNSLNVDVIVQNNLGGPFVVPANQRVQATINYGGAFPFPVEFSAFQDGQSAVHKFQVVPHDPELMDQKFGTLWTGMHAALSDGDKALALTHLSGPAQSRYGPAFDALMPNYASIAASFSTIERDTLSPGVSSYIVRRTIRGDVHAFFVTYERGFDGVWRLEEM